jgi:hypothetical protein
MDWAMVYASLRKDIGDVLQDFLNSENGQKLVQDTIKEALDEAVPYTLLQVETN